MAAIALAACAHAEETSDEASFVSCLAEKEPGLIVKIRDAESEEAFIAALKEGAEVCPTEVEGMSMGKLFKALNAHEQGNTDA
ncbi:hypothetical protein ACFCW2_11890 [Qipengyuania sp. DSG2-2]|uniref:hypothetical protein n=1 Tax=Qipengyuania sp. DGS2-2 TaxID=3349631 RepID=UPI0036D32AE9